MSHRYLTSLGGPAIVIAVALLVPVPVASQTWTLPRTADDQPDLQGVWDFRTITPLERPVALGTKEFFTDEEAANFEKEENRRQDRDQIDPEVGGLMYPPGGVVPYNEFWYDRGNKIVGSKRTSLIVDPPNGRESGPPRGGGARDSAWTSSRRFVGRPTPAGALHCGTKLRTANDTRRLQQ
jgi:hypothetical protein